MKNIIVAGGDKRMSYLAESLFNKGFSPLSYALNGSLKKEDFFKYLDSNQNVSLILPLPLCRDGININIQNGYPQVSLTELSRHIKPDGRIFAGMVSDDAKAVLSKSGAEIIDYHDEEFIEKNAALTAICVLKVINETTGEGVKNKKIAVTGYGRTAKAVALVAKRSGAKVLITARNPTALGEAVKMGYSICLLRDYDCIAHDADIIINTVPARIIDEKILSKLKKTAVIIDIASPPFGVDFSVAEQYNVKAIKALSLPGKYAPKEAGEIICEKLNPLL